MAVKVTSEQEARIRLLSDGELYNDAVRFVDESNVVNNKQMAGLLEFSRSWQELNKFVNHQKGRDWQVKKQYYRDFYTKLSEKLKQLRGKVQKEYAFVPSGLIKKESNQYADYFAGLLAREFIQHLVAEMMWKEEKLP